jgi:hypothetical protein
MPASNYVGWAPITTDLGVDRPWGWTWVNEAPQGFIPITMDAGLRLGALGLYPDRMRNPFTLTATSGVGRWEEAVRFPSSFLTTSPAVGWFPLGPRKPYFPSPGSRGYFTRVNNTNTVINTTISNYYLQRNSNTQHSTSVCQRMFRARRHGGSVFACRPPGHARRARSGCSTCFGPGDLRSGHGAPRRALRLPGEIPPTVPRVRRPRC